MDTQLVERLHAQCDERPFHVGWYLKDLRSGAIATRAGHTVVPAASTRKVAILMAALHAVHQGRLQLEQPVTITAPYQNNISGVFQHLQPGFSIRLQDALTLMIIVSDNTCTGIVSDLVGVEHVNAFSRAIGMKDTTHRNGNPPILNRHHPLDAVNTTTPWDMGLLLDAIVQGSRDAKAAARLGCGTELCQLALEMMSQQQFQCGLPALLPPFTRIAHKTGVGWGYRNINDVGIIYDGENPAFVLAVYTEHVPEVMPDGLPGRAAANQLIAGLCRTCWDGLVQGKLSPV